MLYKHGIAKGKTLTSYPSVKSDIESSYKYKEDSTVVDGKIKIFFQVFILFSKCILNKIYHIILYALALN